MNKKSLYFILFTLSAVSLFLLMKVKQEKTYSDVISNGQITIFSGDDLLPGGAADQLREQQLNAMGLGGYTTVSPQEFVAGAGASVPSVPSQPSTPSASSKGNSGNTTPTVQQPQQPKIKILVWFTDMYGRVIGSSEITQGTTIATSQFPKTVENIETPEGVYTFEKWDYDGRVIEHGLIVRAEYVK